MRHVFATGLLLLVCGVLIMPSLTLEAQQNGVRRPLTMAELTYGQKITAMAPALNGEFWVGGYTCSTTLPTTSDAIQRSWPGSPCIPVGFFERMKKDGTIVYLSYWGGSGVSAITSLVTDASGYLYIGGWTMSSDFRTTPGAYQRTCRSCGEKDGFITKVAPDGSSVVFSTYLGGGYYDLIFSIAVDSTGRVHAAGVTGSIDFPVTAGALQTTFAGGTGDADSDGFYSRLSADGSSLEYSTFLGGFLSETASGVAVDASGDAYVVGTTYSSDFPTLNPAQPQLSGAKDAFVVKFTSTGAVYSTYLGGSGFDTGNAVSVVGDRAYVTGIDNSPDFPGGAVSGLTNSAYIAELAAASGAVTRAIALRGTLGTRAAGNALAVDQNHVAYLAGSFRGSDCGSCGPEAERYPATWDAYGRTLSGGDTDAVLSIVDFRPQTPTTLYSTMVGGALTDEAFGVMPDGSGGAFFAGSTQGMTSVNAQPEPQKDPGADGQSFVAYVSAEQVSMPAPPVDIALYAFDPNGISPTTIAGDWKIEQDSTAAGGWRIHEPDQGAAKVTTPAADPQNYVELEFLADANLPYHLWMRMKADSDSYQNDSVWVQFSDSVDGGNNSIWRIHSTDGTFVSLERCGGCGEQGWGWADNGYGAPGNPIVFATSGWHTIRIQQREDGVSIDQIVLSSSKWANTAPGAAKNDTTILPESFALPSTSTTNAPPTIAITSPASGAVFTAPATFTVSGTTSDSDGSVTQVDIYLNGQLKSSGAPANGQFSATISQVPSETYTITAVATDNQGASTTSSPVTVRVNPPVGLPQGWTDADIGATGAQGSATFNNGTFTVQGAGADVWGTEDALNYVYMPLATDGKIIARVATVSGEANWVKAGVMIRSSLSPSSAQAFMLVSHARGVAFQRRTADGDTTVSTSGSASTAPHWVKLVRVGGVIQGWESPDGVNWTFVDSATFAMPQTVLVGLAVSSHVQGTLATATFDNVQTQALPSGWGDTDIGSVPFPGFANYDGGTFTVTGSGADIWGTADAFHYVWHLMNGNGTIVARAAAVEDDGSPWVKAGLMIRNTFDAGSVHATVLVSAARGVAFQRRDVAGGTSVSTAGSASMAPRWLKLTRSGDTFTAYESPDGTTWTEIGSDTIPMAQTIYVGLAVTSHSTTSPATCAFDHVSIQ